MDDEDGLCRRPIGAGSRCVAIDGPAAAGKTTAAGLVAARLGYMYVDTGAMYRALTLKVLRLGMPLETASLNTIAACTQVLLAADTNADPRVYLDGEHVGDKIRGPEVTAWVSRVSAHPVIRCAMVALQRALASEGGVVMEGRDIGTVVLPEAATKVFLTASRQERARRRAADLRRQGHRAEVSAQYFALRRRDGFDRRRAHSPLKLASDAVLIDTTLLAPDEVAEWIIALHRRDGAARGDVR